MPVFEDFRDPVAGVGERLVRVMAAAISPVVKSRASGRHYSSSEAFPFVVGIDGVGRLEDGTRVYFILPRAPFGSMAEMSVVPAVQCFALPDGLDDVRAAALANPGMSSWAAYTERARLQPGETVLVNGATGTAGRLAVRIAKYLGARTVIATGRDPVALQSLAAVGADVTIVLGKDDDALGKRFREVFSGGVDVVIDYLWGASAESLLTAAAKALPEAFPLRYVQIGAISGPEISLPSAVLRSSAITLMGSGIGSVSLEGMVGAIEGVLKAAVPGDFQVACTPVPLSEVERAWWEDNSARRTVFTMNDLLAG